MGEECFPFRIVYFLLSAFCPLSRTRSKLFPSGVQLYLYVAVWQGIDGKKMINEYVWKGKVGTGSYGKVVSTFSTAL